MEVYLDNSATTKAFEEVGDIVRKVLCEDYGNPSSMHFKGVEAENYLKEAKLGYLYLVRKEYLIRIILDSVTLHLGIILPKMLPLSLEKKTVGNHWNTY